ncbi:MAG: hypothetical protein PHH77_12560, partial [Victivallaceae bacterium]|nr:hypothetical protein [Victivallaceae bacterium]
IDFEMDFGYKPQGDTEYRTRIYGKNRLKRTSGMSMNENELVLFEFIAELTSAGRHRKISEWEKMPFLSISGQ